ncbi:hypothetical protein J6590_052105 [Homalodisca vitripennis]|nr:hypothetical protein J6590_052105 [Homalodisca vitripennis]
MEKFQSSTGGIGGLFDESSGAHPAVCLREVSSPRSIYACFTVLYIEQIAMRSQAQCSDCAEWASGVRDSGHNQAAENCSQFCMRNGLESQYSTRQ